MSNINNSKLTAQQKAALMKTSKKNPTMGPKKRAMHILFYLFYGALCFCWVSGFYDWVIRGEDSDTAMKTLSLFFCVWGIWDIVTMNDNEE